MIEPKTPAPADFGLEARDLKEMPDRVSLVALCLQTVLKVAVLATPVVGLIFWPPWGVLLALPASFVLLNAVDWLGILDIGVRRRINPKFDKVIRYRAAFKQYRSMASAYSDYQLKSQESFWRSLSGRDFELELGKLFTGFGYVVKTTPVSSDGGVDLILTSNDEKVVVQCKAHNKKISIGVARELVASMIDFKAKRGVIACFQGATEPVHKYISNKNIVIVDIETILKHIRTGAPLI